jgi:N-acetylneuraminic acid mutarotase
MKKIFICFLLLITLQNSKAQVFSLQQQNANAPFMPRDGAALVKYNDALYLIAGWNSILVPYPHYVNDFWKSTDEGKTWVQLADAPFTPRHTHGAGVLNNKLYVWGGDGNTDVWYYDAVTNPATPTWTQVTTDWGPDLGVRNQFVSCIHNGYIYVGLGEDKEHSNFYRSQDGLNWTLVGDSLLFDDLMGRGRASMKSLNGALYIVGGGQFKGGGSPHKLYSTVWRSTDEGVTWKKMVTKNDRLKTLWGNLAVMDGYMFFIRGSNEIGANTKGILYSSDGFTWKELNYAIFPRHATSVWGEGNKIYIAAGNLHNDTYTITKIADDY